jgi:hypothetical protein
MDEYVGSAQVIKFHSIAEAGDDQAERLHAEIFKQ